MARVLGFSPRQFLTETRKYGVVFYHVERKGKQEYKCEYCGDSFFKYRRSTEPTKNRFCSKEHANLASSGSFSENMFRFDVAQYRYQTAGEHLGNYSLMPHSKNHQRTNVNDVFFSDGLNSEETTYTYAVLLTDGCILDERLFSLSLGDRDIVEHVARCLAWQGQIKCYPTGYWMRVNSRYLVHDLGQLGCVPCKTKITNYPAVRSEYERHMVRGVIDGDGSWVRRSRSEFDISLKIGGNHELMFGTYMVIKRFLNIVPESVEYPIDYNPRYKMNTYCVIRYNKTKALMIREWIYEDAKYFCTRKRRIAYSVKERKDEFTVGDMCIHLGVSRSFVLTAIKRHKLPHEKSSHYTFTSEHIPHWEQHLVLRLKDKNSKFRFKEQLIRKWSYLF